MPGSQSSDGDGDFDWDEAEEALAPVLIDSGVVADEAAAAAACAALQRLLTGGGDDAASDASGSTATTATTASGRGPGFRALVGGPVLLDEMNRINLHPDEIKKLGKNMIQGLFAGEGTEEDFSLMTEKDAVKIKKLREKQEKQQMAAFMAHQAEARKALAGMKVQVVRHTGGPAVRDIHLENFSISNGGAELIENGNCTLAFGRRYGLVGRNGTGKTTLLRHLGQRAIKGIPDNCQLLHVEQEVVGDDTTALDAVLQCDTERLLLLEEEHELMEQMHAAEKLPGGAAGAVPAVANGGTAAHGGEARAQQGTPPAAPAAANGAPPDKGVLLAQRLAEVGKRLLEIDAYGAPARAAAILAGLSFDTEMQGRATKKFSGGWRMRVALARALFVEPDLLMLDEPTNHLDLHAVLWLQDYLLKWPKTLIVVSHAREFLNTVCTDILFLHSRAITTYRGDYDTFERTMRERVKNAKSAAESQDMKRKHMQAFIDKFRYNANRAALVQSRIKALERLADVEVMEEDSAYVFRFPTPPDVVSPPILSFTDVDFGYPTGPTLYKNLNFGLDLSSRFAIVGPNGIGKSTLLSLISGELEPTRGHVYRNPKVRLATFSQHHVDGLDLALTPLQYMCKIFPQSKEEVHRGQLSSFGIPADLAAQPMYTLSGGQKSRVAMARVTFCKPHLLLLDEPSNHLDMDAVEALVEGLALFQGGVLMVSHDQHLIESTVDELWAVENGTVKVFHGTFEDFKRRLRLLSKH
ncbi:ABC transporter F family member 3 [Micractinium conductrix]|uniref:ABC transporter F family member 3 n=1 Tax=Micractinium conductrix TaxID=554055 RepID=A0A2P6VJ22_9CHLO|nr:ABC transporter F family member 3 [Micractinium conductrix]|eukprot:PSC74057.1 ABC transporter F family member 3 [Micractinium conductrix]